MHGIACINKDKAITGQGLHLIIHEMMHSLADPSVKAIFRGKEGLVLGDEGVNEFFARLVHLIFKSLTGDVFNSIIGSPKGGGAHGNLFSANNRGVYGDLMNRMEYTDLEHFYDEDELMRLARFYFLGRTDG